MRYHDHWNLAMCHAVPQPVHFTWQCVIRYHNQSLSPSNMSYGITTSVFTLSGGTVWHILTHDHAGNEYKISTNSETIKVFDNIYAFVSIENARLHRDVHAEERFLWNVGLGMQTADCRVSCRLLESMWCLGFNLIGPWLVTVWSFTTNLFNFVSIDNKDGHHI
jgi:hypothetical protein